MTAMLNRNPIAVFKSGWLCSILLGCVWLSGAQASPTDQTWPSEPDPHRLVEHTTDRVLAVIDQAQDYYATEPERFFGEIESVLGRVVDFDIFARGVMGKYASPQRYKALTTDAERAAFRARVERFSERFRRGLVETYAQGLLAFNGQRIEVVPPRGEEVSGQAARVIQHIFGDATSKPYTVQYTLRKNVEGHWKLRNVIIEGINIGATYRNQFAAAVETHAGDVDAAIADWNVEARLDTQGSTGSDDEAL